MPILKYSLYRLLILAVSLAVLYFFGLRHLLLVIVAVAIAFCVSYLLLGESRTRVTQYFVARKERPKTDEEYEDQALSGESDNTESTDS